MSDIMRRYLFILLLAAFPCQASSGWTDYGYVIELQPGIHHRYKVGISVKENDSGCKQEQWFYQDYDRTGASEMYLALLEAVSSEKRVRVYVTGRCDINGYSEISEVGIRP